MTPAEAFARALPFVLEMEGGFSDHPDDRGGATNKGITQETYNAWQAERGGGSRSVREIADAEIYAIYKTRYWDAARCDAIPWPLSLCHFDAAVNHGVRTATKILQRALGVADDGVHGTDTHAAIDKADPAEFFGAWYAERLKFYYQICESRPSQKVFLLGWIRRMVHLNDTARRAA